jgi:hypothetical protein
MVNITKNKCHNHPAKSADSFCSHCQLFYCIQCLVESGDRYYCRAPACEAFASSTAQQAAAARDRAYSKYFCQNCIAATDQEEARGTHTINGLGSKMFNDGNQCPTCGSVEASEWGVFLFVRVFRIERYRIKWLDKRRYVGRKLKKRNA